MFYCQVRDNIESKNNATINKLFANVIKDEFAIALLKSSVVIIMMQQFVRYLSRINNK